MALQSSGEIKISDILSEAGLSTTLANASLGDLENQALFTINTGNSSSNYPDGSAPAAISEWYSYDHNLSAYTNTHYYEMDRGQALKSTTTSSPFNLSGSQDLSISLWVTKGATVNNEVIWDMTNSTSTANRFFLQYQYSLNRFVVRHRTGSSNYDRQYSLHDNNSVIGCGTNSGTKWSNTNKGNVNAQGACLLTVTYDASQSNSANGIKLYWNATEVTTQSVANSGSRSTSAVKQITLGNNNHNPTTTAGGFNGNLDEVKIYSSVLTPAQISTIYNSGDPVDATNSYSTNLITEYDFDGNVRDSAGLFGTTANNTGTRATY
tara:strand:- start:589 stop:1554 length:966 start_codon:yes stop_codon:yes gene_type:complete